MKDKILKLLKKHNIDHRLYGKNVAKGNVGICCPLCGDDDGFHLGINLATGKWACWRNAKHRGTNVAYLFAKLFNLTPYAAKELLDDKPVPELFDQFEEDNIEKEVKKLGVTTLEFPNSFYKIESWGTTQRFYNYLIRRGFTDVWKLVEYYGLRCCFLGDFADRVIIPLYKQGKLVTWTSRHIYDARPKYRDLEIEKSVIPSKRMIYNYDNLKGGKILYVVEGPIDALKLDYFSEYSNATCLFTKSATPEQKYLLSLVAPKYDQVIVMLDEDATVEAIDLASELSFIKNLKQEDIPEGYNDPGMMNEIRIKELELSLTK